MAESRNPKYPILAVDDERSILLAIDTTLQLAGFNNIVTTQDGREVEGILQAGPIELMLLDLTMPHIGGEELLKQVHAEHPDVPIIIVTGTTDVKTAISCIKAGAFDYVIKPVEEEQLLAVVHRAVAFRDLERENVALRQHILSDNLEAPDAFENIITRDRKMLSVFKYVESIARTSQPVLITGETGVGKELIAKVVHRLSGLTGRFVAVNVAGVDDNVFSDTLFGHVKGAFTGAERSRPGLIEEASGGTLFLDEIGDLSHASQVKLLRLLQEAEYLPLGLDKPRTSDARIVTSTNKDIWELQGEGKFRKDLGYRLGTHLVHIPPLRDRKDDTPLLVHHFLEEASRALDKKKPTPPKELFPLLESYLFPGNIRELQAMIYDAVSRHTARMLSLEVIKEHIVRGQSVQPEVVTPVSPTPSGESITFHETLPTLKEAAQLLVAEAMERSGGNQSLAARMLGISQQALSKRLKKADG